jgi:hypothetical protein
MEADSEELRPANKRPIGHPLQVNYYFRAIFKTGRSGKILLLSPRESKLKSSIADRERASHDLVVKFLTKFN